MGRVARAGARESGTRPAGNRQACDSQSQCVPETEARDAFCSRLDARRNRRAGEGSQQRKCDFALRCGGGQLRQRGALWALRWSALLYRYKQPLLSLLPRALEALHIAEHVAQHLVSPEPRRVERIPGLVAAPHPYHLVAAAPGDVLVAAPPRYPPE